MDVKVAWIPICLFSLIHSRSHTDLILLFRLERQKKKNPDRHFYTCWNHNVAMIQYFHVRSWNLNRQVRIHGTFTSIRLKTHLSFCSAFMPERISSFSRSFIHPLSRNQVMMGPSWSLAEEVFQTRWHAGMIMNLDWSGNPLRPPGGAAGRGWKNEHLGFPPQPL